MGKVERRCLILGIVGLEAGIQHLRQAGIDRYTVVGLDHGAASQDKPQVKAAADLGHRRQDHRYLDHRIQR